MTKNKIHLVQKIERLDINEISVYHDLIVDENAKTRCLKLGIKSYKTYDERPEEWESHRPPSFGGLQQSFILDLRFM
jgi:hypothetical protein